MAEIVSYTKAAIDSLLDFQSKRVNSIVDGTVSDSVRAGVYLRSAIDAGTARIVFMGDSTAEGTGVSTVADRMQNRVVSGLRNLIAGGDQGVGYIPAYYETFFALAEAPTLAGSALKIGTQGGFGNRSVQLGATGDSVTWKSTMCNRIRVWYTKGNLPYQAGIAEVFVDGVKVGEINGQDTVVSSGNYVEYTLGTLDNHIVKVAFKTGSPYAFRVDGVEFRTSTTGIMGYDGSHSGWRADLYAQGKVSVGAPETANYHWQCVQAANPHLVVVQLGRNDMAGYDPDSWATNIQIMVDKLQTIAPLAGLLWVMAPNRAPDLTNNNLIDHEVALTNVLLPYPNASILFESTLWQPTPGADADPLNVYTDESGGVHPNARGNKAMAYAVLNKLIGIQAANTLIPPNLSTIPSAQISDSTVLGRSVLTAATAAAARTTLGTPQPAASLFVDGPAVGAATVVGNWDIPEGAVALDVEVCHPGAGGGSGMRGATGTQRGGGGSGAGGGISRTTVAIAQLPAGTTKLYYNLPAPGAGGAAVTTDNTNGNPGGYPATASWVATATGNPTAATSICNTSTGSNAGGYGGSPTGGGYGTGPIGDWCGNNGVSSSATGGAGVNGSSPPTATNGGLGASGGSGGGVTSANVAGAGGAGGWSGGTAYAQPAGGTAGATGGNGGNGAKQSATPRGSSGGGGGGGATAGVAGNGGNGGDYGAGGGGGGASTNGFNSGAGGAGGRGYIKILVRF